MVSGVQGTGGRTGRIGRKDLRATPVRNDRARLETSQAMRERVEGLQALSVVICDRGERVQVIELPDPREKFIREFNAKAEESGLTAEIVHVSPC
jgi:hypothetical protein